MKSTAKGIGGNFESRPNPFTNTTIHAVSTLSFTEILYLAEVLDVVTKAGCAILIGTTRDGGAVVLTILDGDKRHRTYCSNGTELQAAADALLNMYKD